MTRESKKMKSVIPRIVFSVLILIAAGIAFYLLPPSNLPMESQAKADTIVNEKISQGADIIINSVGSFDVRNVLPDSITFNPPIKGQWAASEDTGVLIFRPEEKLDIGSVYAVNLPLAEGTIVQDFQIVDSPEVLSILPSADSEADETAEITLLFNRPMIPMTTLGTLDKADQPYISLKPETEGQWKWISTKALQFQPKTTLIPSSHYEVELKGGLRSLDGVEVKSFKHTFITRPLRLVTLSRGALPYNKPITIRFNQQVDLERTGKEVKLFNSEQKQIPFLAEYGMLSGKEDKSVIAIFSEKDRNGRERLWNTDENYSLSIKTAYPLGGDINFEEEKTTSVIASGIVKGIFAGSERSSRAELDFFDPEGDLRITFHEAIDLKKSQFESPSLKGVEYYQKCDTEKEITYVDGEEKCTKIDDRTAVVITFDPKKFALGGASETLTLKKIVNEDGLTINPDPVTYTLVTPSEFRITGFRQREIYSLTELKLCSNAPIYRPDFTEDEEGNPKENVDDFIKANEKYRFQRWESSYYNSREKKDETSNREECPVGEFSTVIRYQINPETDYIFDFTLADVYGRKAEKEITFRSGEMRKEWINMYHFQDRYNVTSPDRTKLTFAAQNIENVNVTLCRVSPETLLSTTRYSLRYETPVTQQVDCLWQKDFTESLKGDWWDKDMFQIDLAEHIPEKYGHYIVDLSNPNYIGYGKVPVHEFSIITITDLSVVEKHVNLSTPDEKTAGSADAWRNGKENLYWVTSMITGNSIAGATVESYQRPNYGMSVQTYGKGVTDKQGVLRENMVPEYAGSIVRKDADSTLILPDNANFNWGSYANTEVRAFVYTDRPLYRPGDEVNIKGLYRRGYDGDYSFEKGAKVMLKVMDSQWKLLYDEEVKLSEFGTFNTKFRIDTSVPLGEFQISLDQDYNVYGRFDVQEYEGSPFELTAETAEPEYMDGDTLQMTVSANYFFGLPLEGGKVQYSISAQDYHFDRYTDEYFDFGGGWYDCYGGCYGNDTFITRGEAELNSDGQAKIAYPIDFAVAFKNEEERSSKIFVVRYSVQNSSGEQVSGETSFIVHAGDYYFGINTDRYFVPANEEFNVKIKTVDTQGVPLKVGGAKMEISKVTWSSVRRKEVDGGWYYRSEKKKDLIETHSVSTDNNGNWEMGIRLKDAGEYEVRVSGKGKNGKEVSTTHSLYIFSDRYADEGVVRPTNDTTLEITNEKPDLNVGDTGRLLIQNPFKGKAKALIAIERGKIFDYKIVDVEQAFYPYEFEVKEEYIPNVQVSVALVSAGSEAGVKFGATTYRINTDKKELQIDIKTDKDNYLPGEKVSLEVTAKDVEGKPVAAELSLAVVDLSVLALKGNPHKNPVMFFYNEFPLTVVTSSNLKSLLQEVEIKNGKGGGGASAEAALSSKKRGEFRDTAYWKADIKTDANGKATLTFTLPDNLTRWQFESVGLTSDNRFGVAYKEATTSKKLMLTPLKPRFIVPGDIFKLGAKIFNDTDETRSLSVNFESDTLGVNGQKGQKLKLAAGETQTVYFSLTAPENRTFGNHTFTLSGVDGQWNDTVEDTISITPNETYETVATSGESDEDSAKEFIFLPPEVLPEKGHFKVNASATLAVFLSDGLNALMRFPYGCTEQIASKLDAIAVLKKGLSIKNVGDLFEVEDVVFDGHSYTMDEMMDLGIARLYANQNTDGGFAYYKGWKSDFYLTLRVLQSLTHLKEAGMEIPQKHLTDAARFIVSAIKGDRNNHLQGDDVLIFASYTLSEAGMKTELRQISTLLTEKVLKDMKVENVDNLSLVTLALIMEKNQNIFGGGSTLKKIEDALESRVRIDARGAYLPVAKARNWRYYESAAKNTALMLQLIVEKKEESPLQGNILRWLMNARNKDGAWGSTADTLIVMQAMMDYMVWQGENLSDFTLAVDVDGEALASFAFNSANIFKQESAMLSPLNKLGLNKLLPVTLTRTKNNDEKNRFYYDMQLQYFLPAGNIPARDEGFAVERGYYELTDKNFERPVSVAKVGDILKGRLTITVPDERHFVAVEDYLPAGVELINFDYATESRDLLQDLNTEEPEGEVVFWKEERKLKTPQFYPDREELRDDRVFLFNEDVRPGTYVYDYTVRVLIPGEYQQLPAMVSEMYFPENFGRTAGKIFKITE